MIGVYEPLILVVGGQVHRTSRAAEDAGWQPAGAWYHSECWAAAGAEL